MIEGNDVEVMVPSKAVRVPAKIMATMIATKRKPFLAVGAGGLGNGGANVANASVAPLIEPSAELWCPLGLVSSDPISQHALVTEGEQFRDEGGS